MVSVLSKTTPRKLSGLFFKYSGSKPSERMTTRIFITIPATRTNAYFLGLPSCLSFAKGSVANVSKKMIQHIHVTYCGCLLSPAASAICGRNKRRQAVNKIVVKKTERESVLYSFFLSSDCENRK